MSGEELEIVQSSDGLIADVRGMIAQTREGVARTVNAGMTLLYWRIGKRIQSEVLGGERAEYGKEILATLSRELGWVTSRHNNPWVSLPARCRRKNRSSF